MWRHPKRATYRRLLHADASSDMDIWSAASQLCKTVFEKTALLYICCWNLEGRNPDNTELKDRNDSRCMTNAGLALYSSTPHFPRTSSVFVWMAGFPWCSRESQALSTCPTTFRPPETSTSPQLPLLMMERKAQETFWQQDIRMSFGLGWIVLLAGENADTSFFSVLVIRHKKTTWEQKITK